ncbi:MAG TPA: fluoride efflux transporter CrcB [Allosphingosinicella sp.]|nr:fluoride efflux transporter CrcB [Allosphingosinicella sp.]
MQILLLVMLGGAIGAGLRHLVGMATLAWAGPGFPWGTLIVNLTGGLAIGLLAGWLARSGGSEQMRLFAAVGVLGGFTTFSAFSLETWLMLERGQLGLAAIYVATSVAGSVLLLFAGLAAMRAPA